MQNNNRNNKSPFGTIFTLLAFFLGIVLYIIIKQNKEEEREDGKEGKAIIPKRKKLPKKVNKTKGIEEEIETIKLTDRQKKIVRKLIEKDKVYPSELQELLPDVSTRTIRRDMNGLEKKGLVEQKGTTKSTYYKYIGS
jgi:predicted HTH transcriptional regulator